MFLPIAAPISMAFLFVSAEAMNLFVLTFEAVFRTPENHIAEFLGSILSDESISSGHILLNQKGSSTVILKQFGVLQYLLVLANNGKTTGDRVHHLHLKSLRGHL